MIELPPAAVLTFGKIILESKRVLTPNKMEKQFTLNHQLQAWYYEIFQAQERGDTEAESQKLRDLSLLLSDDRAVDINVYRQLCHVGQRYKYLPSKEIHVVFCTPINHVTVSRHLIENSIGTSGSEEIMLRTADQLAELGYRVTILSNVKNFTHDTLPHCNPRFHPVSEIETFTAWDRDLPAVVFAHRDTRFELLKEYVRGRVIYWPWDWPSKIPIGPKLDGVLCVSEHVRKALISANPDPELELLFSQTGVKYHAPILPKKFIEDREKLLLEVRDPRRCVFVSGHHRGLSYLIKVWLKIVEKYPDAKLDIYYGRTTFINYEWPGWSKEEQDYTYSVIENHESITEMGRVSHDQLNQAFSKAGFMLLPSNFPETLCITAIKAQYFGCIPLVSSAVSREVIFEEIPILDFGGQIGAEFLDDYYKLLDDYLSQPDLPDLRRRMSDATYERYSAEVNTLNIIDSFFSS